MERPILFSTPMVQALLEDRKTQTRRVIKPQPSESDPPAKIDDASFWLPEHLGKWLWLTDDGKDFFNFSPYGKPGDVLWVRETWAELDEPDSFGKYLYKANDDTPEKWKPSIFMPRAACRLRLEITDVKVERLQEISEEDAIAEGIASVYPKGLFGGWERPDRALAQPAKSCYEHLWNTINEKPGTCWEDNPFVWAITFKKL